MKDTVYDIVTERIMAQLEKGVVPWHKPWAGGANGAPKNLKSGKDYRGVNVFLLGSVGFTSPYWVSFKQAQELGGCVRRGEKGMPVVFWKWLDGEDDAGQAKKIPMLRYYTVFNVAQVDGIEGKVPVTDEAKREHKAIELAESIVKGMPKAPTIRHGNGQAYYSPSGDYVGMPKPEVFDSPEFYYSTLFHELTHATGHESRLNRKGVASTDGKWSSFGTEPYAKEELVAEMGAAFLCGHVGIVERTVDNSAAYVANWLTRLKDDRKLVVQAAAQAQKASDFILGRTFEEQA